MKQLWILTRVYLLNAFELNKIRNTADDKERRKLTGRLIGYIVIFVMLAGSMFTYFSGMGYAFNSIGHPEYIMTVACAAACVASFITTVFHVSGTLVAFQDYDAVMSLPLRQGTVVVSRMLKLYGSNLLFLLFIMIPACVAYVIFAAPGTGFYVVFLVTLLFLPLIPVALSGVIGLALSALTVGFRRKNLANIIVSMIFIIAVMVLSFSSASIMEQIGEIGEKLANGINRLYPPAAWYAAALAGDYGMLALFLVVSILPITLFVLLVSRAYRPLHAVLTRQKRVTMRGEVLKRRSSFAALFNKDLRRYFASPIYVTNTLFGSVLLLAGAAALLIFGGRIRAAAAEMGELVNILYAAMPFILSFFTVMSATTPVSISIEGNRLWQLKALPIRIKEVFKSKLCLSLVIILPPLFIASTVAAVFLQASLFTTVLLFVTPAVYALFAGVLGLWLNMKMPKLNWKSETEIVKQSMPVMINVFLGMFLTFVPAMVLPLLLPENVISLAAAGVTLILLLLSVLLWARLVRKGDKLLLALK